MQHCHLIAPSSLALSPSDLTEKDATQTVLGAI